MREDLTVTTLGGRREIVRSTCMMSHGGCGILVHVRDGTVVKVEGDPDHPITRGTLCPKGLAGVQLQNHPDRLLYPLRRVGARGEGRWERIDWDEALDIIAARLTEIRDASGPEAIAVSCGTGRAILQYARRFGNVLGSPHHAGVPHVCWRPQLGSAQMTFGRPIHYDLTTTECLVVVGANWVHSNSGQGIFAREFMDLVRRGTKVISIDPRLSAGAGQSSVWLQLRPGTDCALLLAWTQVIIAEGLYDAEFVSRWTTGFAEIAQGVAGCTPEWAERVTWVPAEAIRDSARLYATSKPACISVGVALEQSTNSFNTLRAAYNLVALTGNVDVPGGNTFWENPLPAARVKALVARDRVAPEATARMIGDFPLVDGSSPGHAIWRAIVTGEPYPVRAVLVHGSNPLLTQEDPSGLVEKALRQVEFLVVSDMFLTPTAQLADLVLPAATYLEKDDVNLRPVTNRGYLSCSVRAVAPRGEARDDREVFIEICRRMGLDYGFESISDLLDWLLEPAGVDMSTLAEGGPIQKEQVYGKHEIGKLRADGQPGFATPSGLIELVGDRLADQGLDPMPVYLEPPESPLSRPDLLEHYPLVLTTGSRLPMFFHTQYHELPWLQEIAPEPRVELHPDAAAELGIEEGMWVFVENQRGRCRQRARLTRGIDRRVVHADFAWWTPHHLGADPALSDSWRPNINLLVSGDPPYDQAFGSTQMRGLLCRVYPADEESDVPPAVQDRPTAGGSDRGIANGEADGRESAGDGPDHEGGVRGASERRPSVCWADGLTVEAAFCMGCRACEVACKQEHHLPPGVRLIRIVENLEKERPDTRPAQFRPVLCRHCREPRCVTVCPTGALVKHESGTVVVLRELCHGCRACFDHCPYGAPQFRPEDGTVVLCDLCAARGQAGARPACVVHCPAEVLGVPVSDEAEPLGDTPATDPIEEEI